MLTIAIMITPWAYLNNCFKTDDAIVNILLWLYRMRINCYYTYDSFAFSIFHFILCLTDEKLVKALEHEDIFSKYS